MSEYDELGRTLRTLLLQEADAMDIDTHEATERLVRELGPTESRRRPIVVALVACAVVVVALLAGPTVATYAGTSHRPTTGHRRRRWPRSRTTSTSPTEQRRPPRQRRRFCSRPRRPGVLTIGRPWSTALARGTRPLFARRPALPGRCGWHGPAPTRPAGRAERLLPPGRRTGRSWSTKRARAVSQTSATSTSTTSPRASGPG